MHHALVADDHPLFRAALIQALSPIFGTNINQTECLSSTFTFLRGAPETDIVFLDLTMPGNDGLSGLVECHHTFPNTIFVIVSAHESASLMSKAIQLGAGGFIPKSTPLTLITAAVEQILEGEIWLPEGVDCLSSGEDSETQVFLARLALLTPHQLIVLKYMADGLLNKQIAYEMQISESTVKQHASAVLKKLNLINRTKAGVMYKQFMDSGESSS